MPLNIPTEASGDGFFRELRALRLRLGDTTISEASLAAPWVTTTCVAALATPGTSSWVYATQSLIYRITGDMVDFVLDLDATLTLGTGSGALSVSLAEAVSGVWPINIGQVSNITDPASTDALVAEASASKILFYANRTASTPVAIVATTHFADGVNLKIRLSGRYRKS